MRQTYLDMAVKMAELGSESLQATYRHSRQFLRGVTDFDDEGNYHPTDVCQCPGAAAVARKYGRDTVMVQVATRMGVIPEDHFDSALELTIGKDQLNVDPQKAKI